MGRLVVAPGGLTLPNGQNLPRGVAIGFANPDQALSPVQSTYSRASEPPLNEFHPDRFLRLRSQGGEGNKHQFVTTSTENLHFGHGMHACPGRFFASNEIKIVLVEMLRRYEVSLVNKERKEEARPKNMWFESQCMPDPYGKVYLRKRGSKG
jgi:hypothetical protein